MLRQVLTYNFSDDETRTSFEELMNALGFVKSKDQSTYVLDIEISMMSSIVRSHIVQWSKSNKVKISESDFVQIFYNTTTELNERKISAIGTRFLSYDKATKALI